MRIKSVLYAYALVGNSVKMCSIIVTNVCPSTEKLVMEKYSAHQVVHILSSAMSTV